MKMIVAHGYNNAIGKGNRLPWRVPEDMQFFKRTTLNHHNLLVGKNTLMSLPNQRLPHRKMHVLSTTYSPMPDEVVLRDKNDVLELNKTTPLMVIGGQKIYETFLPYADTLFITRIMTEVVDADAFFPDYEDDFQCSEVIKQGHSNGLAYDIELWRRK